MLQKEFNVTDYSNLVPDQYPSVVDTVQGMYDDYTDVSEICKTIFKIGGADQAAAIQAGLTTLGAADLGAITYENLPAINTAVAGYHQQYLDAGFGQ